jgi:D-serine dehydratase
MNETSPMPMTAARSMRAAIDELGAQPLPATLKGLPAAAVGRRMSALGSMSLSLLEGHPPLPAVILRRSAIEHNAAWMRAFTERAGVLLCPHGKTTMAPQLFQRQLAEGAWGITAATAAHVRTCRQFGVPRVLLANQLVGRANIDLVFDELRADPAFDLYLLVDSLAGLAPLQAALAERPLPGPLQVLLEVGAPRGRTGVRSFDEAVVLGRALRDAGPAIALRGIEAFEGIHGGDDHASVEFAVLTMLTMIGNAAKAGCEEGWFAPGPVILSAGGSAFFDIAAEVLGTVSDEREMQVVLRSGCYLSHDSLHYARMQSRIRQRAKGLWGSGPGLQNALEVWAHVQSTPERGRAICSAGKRDLSHDLELPRPDFWFRPGLHGQPQPVAPSVRVTSLNDQHAIVDGPEADLPWAVGDLVGFGVGHPCTTFDKWPLLYLVDDAYGVVGGIRTFF